MITNNSELNQYIANLKAHCTDVLVQANNEAMSCSNNYERCIELNARITDYLNFINMLNMETLLPKSVLDSRKEELSVGDEVYVITKCIPYEERMRGVKRMVVRGYVKKCITTTKRNLYVITNMRRGGYHIGNFVKASLGKTIFHSKEEAEKHI